MLILQHRAFKSKYYCTEIIAEYSEELDPFVQPGLAKDFFEYKFLHWPFMNL